MSAAVSTKKIKAPEHSHEVAPLACKMGCNDDCTILTVCSSEVPVQINCRVQTGGLKPYCNSEEYICDTKPDFCTPAHEARCDLRDGFYPNLIDCEK